MLQHSVYRYLHRMDAHKFPVDHIFMSSFDLENKTCLSHAQPNSCSNHLTIISRRTLGRVKIINTENIVNYLTKRYRGKSTVVSASPILSTVCALPESWAPATVTATSFNLLPPHYLHFQKISAVSVVLAFATLSR